MDDSKSNKKNKDIEELFLKASKQNSKNLSMKDIKKELKERYEKD